MKFRRRQLLRSRTAQTAVVAFTITAALGCSPDQAGPGAAPGTSVGSGIEESSIPDVYLRVSQAIESDRLQQAATLLNAEETDSTSAIHIFLVGRLREKLGFATDARDRYQRAVTRDSTLAAGWYHLALSEVAAQRYGDAVTYFKRAIAIRETAQAWHGIGQAHVETGEADSALTAFDRSLAIDPTYVPGRVARAAALLAEGDVDGAEETLRPAVEQAGAEEARRMLANILVSESRAEEALELLQPLREARPHDAQVAYDLGRTLRMLGREAEAREELGRFEELSQVDAAVFRLQERIRLTPTSLRDRLELVDVYRMAGRLDEALGTLYPVMYLVPDNLHLRNNAAILHLARGDTAAARSLFESALEVDPDFEPARVGLERLGSPAGQ